MNLNKILDDKILLFDGGMGTEIYKRGVFINKCYEELNLNNPGLIRQIHVEYLEAGADIISTNTFGANKIKLQKFSLYERLYEINFEAAKMAKEATQDNQYVAGSVGPLGTQIEPLGPISYNDAKAIFKEQIKPLLDGGVDLILFETFINQEELKAAVEAAKELKDIPTIAQLTIDDDGTTLLGTDIKTTINNFEKINTDVLGVNCTVGPRSILNWLEQARKYTDKRISVMPNAGKPENINGRNIYLTSPEYLGEYLKHFASAGANIIGGCCGTGPEHIQKMRNMLNSLNRSDISNDYKKEINISNDIKEQMIEIHDKSDLGSSISNQKFVKFVELLAPKGIDYQNVLEKSQQMKDIGIDIINIPDGPRASARMSASALAILLQQHVGIETVLHFVCRDKNIIGIQSDLMGYYALGLKNILAITGDPPKLGTYPDATAVYDVDSIGLVNIINRLNHGKDLAGDPIGKPTGFTIGVGCNPGAVDLDKEIERLYWKKDAGAEYAVTQPVFDSEVFLRFLDKISHINIPIIAGIWPLVSIRNAEFMNNEVPGVDVPSSILKKMRTFEGNKEGSLKMGIEIAVESIEEIKNKIAGVQISAPFGRVSTVIDILTNFPKL
ncbi:bifunctional homocysteine S-methyltransferase/methylenetetrahydrofolate reductase [Candidatus Kapabacteria bacterium]|nr:bifunctional homocysteine S-methyltransferase/methylenetetrahydrofolate reductase [Candidatus Kapabacteria bacterium]